MPNGKPAGVRCVQLGDDERCRIFGQPERSPCCAGLQPSAEMCGASREHAIRWLHALEQATAPGHSSVPDLQLISIDLQLEVGSVYRMLSQLDDGSGSGYCGLYLVIRDAIESPCTLQIGSIYRTRELSELPVEAATVAVTEADGPNAVVRMEMGRRAR